ncbi:MAG: outer membrane cobalamin receptor [Myxococcota bacterium]|jgi:iron complex outermembrane receptor protein
MFRRRWLLPFCGLLAVALPLTAHADPKDDARRHFRAGLEAARAGDFDGALERFMAAQDTYPHPVTLYNIARAYQDMGDLDNALEYYELYRDADPSKADDVSPVIAVIRARRDAQNSPAEPEPTAETSTTTASSADVERLRALVEEMEALVDQITAEPEPAVAVVDSRDGPDGTVIGPTAGLPIVDAPSFQDDAYERVVVTASRFGQAPLDSPSTIGVITSDDIRLSGLTNIPDLLRRVAGVDVMSKSAGHSDISIRGFNRELSNKVLVLVDGRSTTLDFLGTTLWNGLPISVDEIDRIEVIRGPGSAVYGANATTGVVNIITRTPGEGGNTVSFNAGTPGVIGGSALLSGRKDNDAWRLSVGWQEHDRWGSEVDLDATSSRVGFLEDTDTAFRAFRANARVDHSFLEKGLASFSGSFSDSDVELYNIGVLGNFGTEILQTVLRTDIGYGPVLLRAFWNHDVGRTGPWVAPLNPAQSLDTPFRADTFDVELSGNGDFTTGPVEHRTFGGVGYRRKELRRFLYMGDDAPTITQDHFNAFVNHESTVGVVKLVGSLRVDAHPLIPVSRTISPRGAAIIRIDDDRAIRVNGGSAFRGPTLIESYMDFRIPTGVDGVYIRDFGSETLLPERILTAEVGYHDESSALHTADLVVYVNQINNLIGLDSVTPTAEPYEPGGQGWEAGRTGWINTDPSYLGWGVEAEGELFPVDGVDLYGTLNISSVMEREAGISVADRSTSLFKTTAGASWRTPWRTDISADVQVYSDQTWRLRQFDDAGQINVSPSPVGAHAILSARIAFRPLPDEKLELSVQGWNLGALASDGFREHPTGQRVRSRLTGALRYTF